MHKYKWYNDSDKLGKYMEIYLKKYNNKDENYVYFIPNFVCITVY